MYLWFLETLLSGTIVFCFRIRCARTLLACVEAHRTQVRGEYIVAAQSAAEMKIWLQVFHAATVPTLWTGMFGR